MNSRDDPLDDLQSLLERDASRLYTEFVRRFYGADTKRRGEERDLSPAAALRVLEELARAKKGEPAPPHATEPKRAIEPSNAPRPVAETGLKPVAQPEPRQGPGDANVRPVTCSADPGALAAALCRSCGLDEMEAWVREATQAGAASSPLLEGVETVCSIIRGAEAQRRHGSGWKVVQSLDAAFLASQVFYRGVHDRWSRGWRNGPLPADSIRRAALELKRYCTTALDIEGRLYVAASEAYDSDLHELESDGPPPSRVRVLSFGIREGAPDYQRRRALIEAVTQVR